MLAMSEHHTAWIHLPPLGLFVSRPLLNSDEFKGDPHYRLKGGKKKKKKNCTDLFLEL